MLAACGDDEDSTTSAAAGAGAATSAQAAPSKLTLAVVPSEDAAAIKEQFQPFIEFVSERVGIDVELIPSTSYAAVIEALRADKADIALLGPLAYVIATNNGVELDPIGAQIPAKGIAPTYRSYGVVAGDSEMTSIAEAKGKKVCFADPSSTSGYLYPSQALLAEGIDPEEDVDGLFAGGPDKAAIGAAKGQCDIGFSFDAMVEAILPDAGQLEEGDVKVIWKSDPIPGSPVVVRSKLDDETKAKVRDAVLAANNDAYVEAGLCESADECGVGGTYGYAPAEADWYERVRDACKATKLEACQEL